MIVNPLDASHLEALGAAIGRHTGGGDTVVMLDSEVIAHVLRRKQILRGAA
jgi:hypothetical protein